MYFVDVVLLCFTLRTYEVCFMFSRTVFRGTFVEIATLCGYSPLTSHIQYIYQVYTTSHIVHIYTNLVAVLVRIYRRM